MDCHKRAALLTFYQQCVQSFADTVNTLHQARDEKWRKGFMMHWDAAHEALSACTHAHDRLAGHILAHRCEEMDQVFEKEAA
jgi:hypothetical protein